MEKEIEGAGSAPALEPASSVSSPTQGVQQPTGNALTDGQATQDWKAEYDRLNERYSQTDKSYAELRKKMVSQGTEKNSFEKRASTLETELKRVGEALAKATKAPYDPEQFMEELRTQGPDLIMAKAREAFEAARAEQSQPANEAMDRVRQIEQKMVFNFMKADKESFPNFIELGPAMGKILERMVEEHQLGIRPNDPNDLPVEELLSTLYDQAKLLHSQDALETAEKRGAEKERANLATEARTAVAGGGKAVHADMVDPNTLPLAQHRQYLIDRGFGKLD